MPWGYPPELPPGVVDVLLGPEEIAARVRELAAEVSAAYAGRELLLVPVLKGALPFAADLMRALTLPLTLDFAEVRSYQGTTAGELTLLRDVQAAVEGADVLVVEDIVDTGASLHFLLERLAARRPASLAVCSLLDKPARRAADVRIDFRGFEVPDVFVVGYGLDYEQRYRNLPFIGTFDPGEGGVSLAGGPVAQR